MKTKAETIGFSSDFVFNHCARSFSLLLNVAVLMYFNASFLYRNWIS